MQKTRLRKYARLIARVGVNVQKGQDVILNTGLEQPEFVTMVVDELYKWGARKVFVKFNYQPLEKYHVRHRSVKALSTMETFEEAELKYMADNLCARLFLNSDDPDGLKGMNIEKNMKGQQARAPISKGYREQMNGKHQWCIAAVPGEKWAKKVFPNERVGRAVELLWEAILSAARVDDDPIAAWAEHNADLQRRYEYLNSLGIETLEYKSANGTDLRVGLMEDSIFRGGRTNTAAGVYYNPNLPTEECFTSPKKGMAEGIVYSSKPLSYQGQVIDKFYLRFEGGKAVEAYAEQNNDLLQKMISMDEGAAYLGECALVPFTSPINESGLLFYKTLYDENACCHFAMGRGFENCVRGWENLTVDEIKAKGMNDSIIHVDFMIGTADLSIVAHCRDGKTVQIFKDGGWAF